MITCNICGEKMPDDFYKIFKMKVDRWSDGDKFDTEIDVTLCPVCFYDIENYMNK